MKLMSLFMSEVILEHPIPIRGSSRSKILLQVPPSNFYTSALSTAHFLNTQKPKGSAYVIGEGGLLEALADVGYKYHSAFQIIHLIIWNISHLF
jgi:ribonucleotide monophosphatase NagD (HAD superfamily)